MRAYVISWQSPTMSAPTFWYYAHKRLAQDMADEFRRNKGYKVTGPTMRMVPKRTVLSDLAPYS